jgi:hypothetical protein
VAIIQRNQNAPKAIIASGMLISTLIMKIVVLQ